MLGPSDAQKHHGYTLQYTVKYSYDSSAKETRAWEDIGCLVMKLEHQHEVPESHQDLSREETSFIVLLYRSIEARRKCLQY